MPDEFSIGGSFAKEPGYEFGGLLGGGLSGLSGSSGSLGLGVGSLNPSYSYTSAPVATSTPKTTSSGSTSNEGSGFGGILSTALNTATSWLGGIATLDIFGRAQDKGLAGGGTTATGTTTTTQQPAMTGSGLPSWAIPAAIGGGVLLILLVLMMRK